MPNIWTHNLFGLELMKLIGHQSLLDDTRSKHVFQLGCQGPDFLFYHHFFPWQKDKTMSALGSMMHKQACGPILDAMVQFQKQRGKSLADPETLYVLGFLTHHVLDRNMHPYVFYKSGFKKWDHQRFEVIIDTIMVRKHLGLETWKTPVWKELEIGTGFPADLVDMFEDVQQQFFPDFNGKITREGWNDAYRDMIRAQKIFHDPYGIKRVLTFGQIEPLVYKKRNADLDYMNEKKEDWHDPTSLDTVYNDSAWDLWDKAVIDGKRLLESAAAIFQETKPDEALFSRFIEFLGNISYETGKPVESKAKILYADPII